MERNGSRSKGRKGISYWWWKVLAILLLVPSVHVALHAPLAPALVHVSPGRVDAGPVTFVLTGYNTSFTNAYQVYLINAGERICATSVEALDERHLQARFDLGEGPRESLSSIVVHHPESGRLGLASAIYHGATGAGAEGADCPAGPSHTLGAGSFNFPNRSILYESIRNLNLHVPMWFTMMVLMGISLYHSLRALNRNDLREDGAAAAAVHAGLLFCALGLVTGAVWARATWGAWWTNDVKLNGAAVTALIYLAYLVLRGSVSEPHRRARLASVYNIFAFMLLVLFLLVLPRLNAIDSLHPGNGGNPAFNQYDLDDNLRRVFYPATAGWILLGIWMFQLRRRMLALQERVEDRDHARRSTSRIKGQQITS
jgi:heme exporter protein C